MNTVATAHGLAEWREGQAGTAELYNLVATPRGEGHGATLLNEVIAQMKTAGVRVVYLFSEADNVLAHKFYIWWGFEVACKLPGFYSHGDALMFVRRL
jgi:ribosomal protein S18 acetylase RimI-like enzyme